MRDDMHIDPWWFKPLLILGVVVIWVALCGVGWVIIETQPWSWIFVGALLWWGGYAFETAINGGRTDFISLLRFARDDFHCAIPGKHSREYKLKLAEKIYDPSSETQSLEEVADMFPGTLHFLWTHVLIPVAPISIWAFIQLL